MDQKEEDEDVAEHPGAGSDPLDEVARFLPPSLTSTYEVFSYRHAAAILSNCHSQELRDIVGLLKNFRLTKTQIMEPGGNETSIVKGLTQVFRDKNWKETRILADLTVTKQTVNKVERSTKTGLTKTERIKLEETVIVPNFVDGHKVDFVKGRVAFDLEWNSKDQTFDRDLYAFRAFYECSLISCGVLLTRSKTLNPLFSSLGVMAKYGASTTWMGKLLYRLNAGRNGGCPVLAIGITPKVVE